MRNSIIGLILGVMLGIVFGATVIAPRLHRTSGAAGPTVSPQTPSDVAAQLPRALYPKPAISIKMVSLFSADVPLAGELAKRLDHRVWELSRGQLEVKFHAPGTLVPAADTLDALGAGTIDAAFASPEVWGQRLPALQIYGGMPFGPTADEFLAWFSVGGGDRLLVDLLRSGGVNPLLCGLAPQGGALWTRQPIDTREEINGLRLAVTGLASDVWSRMGAAVVSLSGGDALRAVEQGTIDAVAVSTAAADRALGFHKHLKNMYFPGLQESALPLFLFIRQDKWQQLSAGQKSQIESVCGDNVRAGIATGGTQELATLKQLVDEGVEIHRFAPAIIDTSRRAWEVVADDVARSDTNFSRIWSSLSDFRDEFAMWRELNAPR